MDGRFKSGQCRRPLSCSPSWWFSSWSHNSSRNVSAAHGVCLAGLETVELAWETGSCLLAQCCLCSPYPPALRASAASFCLSTVSSCPWTVSVPNTTTDLSLRFLSPENLAYRGQEPQASHWWIYLCGFSDPWNPNLFYICDQKLPWPWRDICRAGVYPQMDKAQTEISFRGRRGVRGTGGYSNCGLRGISK